MTSESTRIVRLLDRGFYPVELPPSFATRGFSAVRNTFSPPINYYGGTTFYDGSTFRGVLRTFGIINPVSYFLLSRHISQHWSEITDVYKLSASSGSRPKFPPLVADGRAIETATIARKRLSQGHLASSFPIVLSLDINRFYGSVYTHSIPWAALGKTEAKRQHRARTLTGHWSDRLDSLVRNCNQQQTVGVPIGPDTSRIISELLLSRIDSELCSNGTGITSSRIYHNIDDYQIGAFDNGSAENAQSQFVRTISKYELRLNDFKTSIEQGLLFAPSNFQRQFDILRQATGRSFVEHFFDLTYSVSKSNLQTNVIGYSLKRFSRALATNKERTLVREYLQRLLYAAPFHARWIFPILLGIYRQEGANLEIKKQISWGVEVCTRRNDVGSLLWFIYAAIFLNVKLGTTLCNLCLGMSNDLVDLVLLHGRTLGLFSFALLDIRRRYQVADFNSSSWLPLYEIERRAWDTSPSFTKIGRAEDPNGLYAQLRANHVEFYQTDAQYFSVEAFSGWNLTQQEFGPDAILDVNGPDGDWDNDNDWENYE